MFINLSFGPYVFVDYQLWAPEISFPREGLFAHSPTVFVGILSFCSINFVFEPFVFYDDDMELKGTPGTSQRSSEYSGSPLEMEVRRGPREAVVQVRASSTYRHDPHECWATSGRVSIIALSEETLFHFASARVPLT